MDALLGLAAQHFKDSGKDPHVRVLVNAAVDVREGEHFDNWDGGQHGHLVRLLVPPELAALSLNPTIPAEIREVLSELAKEPGEFISDVHVLPDPARVAGDWRVRTGALLATPTLDSPDKEDETRIWKGCAIRVFLSHKAEFKVPASELRDVLLQGRIGAFVAHEDIEPTRAWHREIEKALRSMDVLVALHSEGFNTSPWTNQEVGVAIGRGIPVLSLRLDEDPKGLNGHTQAINGREKTVQTWATEIIGGIAKAPLLGPKLKTVFLEAWERSTGYIESNRVMEAFLGMGQFSADELARVESAFAANNQLHGCALVHRHYPQWLESQKAGLQ